MAWGESTPQPVRRAPGAASLPPRFDAFDPSLHRDPYPAYARLREAAPVCRGGPGQWVVTRYAEVAALLRDPRLGQFQPDAFNLLPGALSSSIGEGPVTSFLRTIIAGRDRPEHSRLRRLVGRLLTQDLASRIRSRIGDLVDELLAPGIERGGLDAVAELAVPVPLTLMSELLGIPAPDRDEVGRQALRLARIFSPVVSEADRDAADRAIEWLRAYVGRLLDRDDGDDGEDGEDGEASGRDELLAGIRVGRRQGMVDAGEAVDNAIFVLFAGFETSMNLLATGCAQLARHPEAWSRLRADPSLVPAAVEEFLRYDAPTQLTGRIVLEPLEIGGRTIRQGRVLLLLLGSANRDGRRFAEPDNLDVARDPNPHLSFGGGIHYCVGAALARAEAAAVFGRLVRRLAVWEPAGEAEREMSATLRAYERVPVRVRAL
ncbi:MAG TPA: cytochrome P450 [Actinomycetota bacterium]